MDVLRVANNVEECEEDEDCFFCEGRGCILIDPLDESVDDEEFEDEEESEEEDQLEAEGP